MKIEFRPLRADEIEIRVGSVWDGGASLLLYKDARCDMNLLDEFVGPMNWKREHSRDNANCTVSIYDDKKKEWVSKEDTGTMSYTEKEKGLASDSFKRACVNWGIGRELYSSPFISVNCPTEKKGDRYVLHKKNYFAGAYVAEIEYDDNRNVSLLTICDKNGQIIFREDDDLETPISAAHIKVLESKAAELGVEFQPKVYGKKRIEDLTEADYGKALRALARFDG